MAIGLFVEDSRTKRGADDLEAYVNDVTLPAPGTQCRQDRGFPAPAPVQAFAAPQITKLRPHVAPF